MAPLTVAIVGAGPGGLTAALALRNAGHKVDVFERSSFTKPGGFRLALGPNALRVLESVGVGIEAVGARSMHNEVFHNGETKEWTHNENFDYVKPKYGTDWVIVDRPAVQREQMKQASVTPAGLQQIDIHLSSEVAYIRPEEKRIVLKNEREHKADLIIIANGVHSTLVNSLVDGNIPPLQYSRTAYRVEVPMEKMQQDPEIWNTWKDHDYDIVSFAIREKRALLMTGVQGLGGDHSGERHGLLMSPSMKMVDGSDADYNMVVPPEEAAKYVSDFHPMIQRWVGMSQHTTVWTSVYRESLENMARENLIGIGDAVHAHLPHHGQGASSAIEDGASIGPFLDASDPGLTPESLPEYLKHWESFRKPRARCVHLFSIRWPLPLEQIKPDIAKVYDGPLPPHNQDHTEVMWDFLFGYDVLKEAKKAVTKMRVESNGLVNGH
ncbi:hypothetical protein BDV96DRAFT_642920 [Lophiotrema nucula]|uniref:FAD-binding domain-containing protein n=1 Tax=Lophiotrema nucula TaxID=690887 RepID=A0A6A5ZHN0_9PLEO|nr:hypothetical protein BDV96DRAFT_642920 [Lophiotrema nucula]